MAQKLDVMFMRTDGRQGEEWEGAVQGRDMFLFHFSGWEGRGEGVTKMLNRFGVNRKSLPWAVLIQMSKLECIS